MPTDNHECDLFLMSSHQSYTADKALLEFASRGRQNIHGWGIGSFIGSGARVLRSATEAMRGGNVTEEFGIAVEAISSPVILGHLRLASRGGTRRENNHPFRLSFLGSEWLLVHNGTTTRSDLVPFEERLIMDSDSDTPRVFEFLRKRVLEYCAASPKRSVMEAFRTAYTQLVETDTRGGFNLIISNGKVSLAFIHHRPFYMLNREKEPGDAALLSTLRLTDNEDWVKFEVRRGKKARMLLFSGHNLIHNGDIPR